MFKRIIIPVLGAITGISFGILMDALRNKKTEDKKETTPTTTEENNYE